MYQCRLPEALGHALWNDHCLIIDSTCILRLRSSLEAGESPLFPGLTGNGPSLWSSLILCFAVIDFESSSNCITEEGKMRLKRLAQLTKGFLLLPRGWCSRSESRLLCLLNILATIHRLVPFLSLTRIVSVSFWSHTSWVSWGDTRCAAFTDLRVTISCSLVGISLTRSIPPIGTGSSCSQDCYGGHLHVSQLVLPRDQAQQPNGFDLCALQTTVLLAVIFRHKHE